MTQQCFAPLVTVYIPCRNYGRYLAQAVESLMCQLHVNWEAFIVDEASTDSTPAVAAALKTKDPQRLTVVRNDQPIGLQKVANSILARARGKYIVRLDADDWFDEGALLLMVAKLESNPRLGLVYGNYFYTDERGQVLGIERRHRLGVEDVAGHLPPHGACTLVRTRSLKAVGGYSEDINAQDGWELWYKLQNRVGAASLDVPVFYYRQHGASLSRDNTRLLAARARIFDKVARRLEGAYHPVTLAVIAVREDYPGVIGVPYREFEGRSLLEHAILQAAGAKGVSKVIVSSESPNVLAYAESLEKDGIVPQHLRHQRKDGDLYRQGSTLPVRDILLDVGKFYRDLENVLPDLMLFLSIHAVRRRSEHIDKAINMVRITESDSVVSVQEERDPVFTHGLTGLQVLNPGRFHDLSYERERLYSFNGAVIGAWWEVLLEQELLGDSIAYIEMSPEDSMQIRDPLTLDALKSRVESGGSKATRVSQ
ncbi:family 2 glycosyl transferase [Salinisphaera sp. S4-8]|uniref:glycosyltransferase family 2 protein n=1 Tax=Salinisphaera sp. S4-8 TaxID=633357 RepID=UPI003342E22B